MRVKTQFRCSQHAHTLQIKLPDDQTDNFRLTFYPTQDQQTKCKSCGENGLNGDLLVTYDVNRQNPNGEIMVLFFVVFFCNVKRPECTYFSVLSGIKLLFRPLLCTL